MIYESGGNENRRVFCLLSPWKKACLLFYINDSVFLLSAKGEYFFIMLPSFS